MTTMTTKSNHTADRYTIKDLTAEAEELSRRGSQRKQFNSLRVSAWLSMSLR